MWDQAIVPGEDHRSNQATLTSNLDSRGTYIISAFLDKPTDKLDLKAIQIGNSNSIIVLNDLAIVQKNTQATCLCPERTQ